MLRYQCPSFCPPVRLSVTEVHWRIIANLGFKFRSHFTAHCGRSAWYDGPVWCISKFQRYILLSDEDLLGLLIMGCAVVHQGQNLLRAIYDCLVLSKSCEYS